MTGEARFAEAMREVVDEFGSDHKHEPAKFKNGDEPTYRTKNHQYPVCIIGWALYRSGTPLSTLPSWHAVQPSAETLLGRLGFSPLIARAAQRAQMVQDTGGTWGEALEAFNKTIKE